MSGCGCAACEAGGPSRGTCGSGKACAGKLAPKKKPCCDACARGEKCVGPDCPVDDGHHDDDHAHDEIPRPHRGLSPAMAHARGARVVPMRAARVTGAVKAAYAQAPRPTGGWGARPTGAVAPASLDADAHTVATALGASPRAHELVGTYAANLAAVADDAQRYADALSWVRSARTTGDADAAVAMLAAARAALVAGFGALDASVLDDEWQMAARALQAPKPTGAVAPQATPEPQSVSQTPTSPGARAMFTSARNPAAARASSTVMMGARATGALARTTGDAPAACPAPSAGETTAQRDARLRCEREAAATRNAQIVGTVSQTAGALFSTIMGAIATRMEADTRAAAQAAAREAEDYARRINQQRAEGDKIAEASRLAGEAEGAAVVALNRARTGDLQGAITELGVAIGRQGAARGFLLQLPTATQQGPTGQALESALTRVRVKTNEASAEIVRRAPPAPGSPPREGDPALNNTGGGTTTTTTTSARPWYKHPVVLALGAVAGVTAAGVAVGAVKNPLRKNPSGEDYRAAVFSGVGALAGAYIAGPAGAVVGAAGGTLGSTLPLPKLLRGNPSHARGNPTRRPDWRSDPRYRGMTPAQIRAALNRPHVTREQASACGTALARARWGT